jgi:uncharacterized membrane protein
LNELLAATALFVGSHFMLSSAALRAPLRQRLGESRFRGLYSAVALASFAWMLLAYGAAPYIELWPAVPALRWVPLVVMPVAFVLAVAGLTIRSPTAVGGDALAVDSAADPAPGILRVTRHPFLWGVALWALSHLLVNGDAASVLMMGGLALLAFGGMRHIDQRREASLGSGWGPIKLTTSLLPFVAIASRRTTMDWQGLGWWRPLAGLALYLAFLLAHRLIFGVDPLPF